MPQLHLRIILSQLRRQAKSCHPYNELFELYQYITHATTAKCVHAIELVKT